MKGRESRKAEIRERPLSTYQENTKFKGGQKRPDLGWGPRVSDGERQQYGSGLGWKHTEGKSSSNPGLMLISLYFSVAHTVACSVSRTWAEAQAGYNARRLSMGEVGQQTAFLWAPEFSVAALPNKGPCFVVCEVTW